MASQDSRVLSVSAYGQTPQPLQAFCTTQELREAQCSHIPQGHGSSGPASSS